MEEIEMYLAEAKQLMVKSLKHTESELTKLRAGKAMPSMVEGIKVEYYGSMMPLNQVSNVSAPDSRSLLIAPWEKTVLPLIEKAIKESNIGLSPMRDGDVIRINIPILTEERRKSLVKQARQECETGKVGVRSIRKEINDELKKLEKDGVPEDAIKRAELEVQKLTDGFTTKLDELLNLKEKDIMTV